jgi:hypothetical protein
MNTHTPGRHVTRYTVRVRVIYDGPVVSHHELLVERDYWGEWVKFEDVEDLIAAAAKTLTRENA